MEKMKNLARLAVVVVLTTGVFAGISGPANADDEQGTTTSTTTTRHRMAPPMVTVNRFADTGWG
jgi:hypothetical protein